ncbi:MAG: TolC family protein [Gemmatimonadota bacterium]|nr:TolC family protein [Gemmatimonadota bacterium]
MRRLLLCLPLVSAPLAGQVQAPRALSLEEALQIAVPASDAVTIARADIQRADGEVKRVRADLLPQLTGSASYTRTLKSQFSTGSGRVDSTATTSCTRFAGDPNLPVGERVDSLERTVECLSSLNPFAALGNLPFGRKNQYNFGLQFSQTLFSSGILKGRPRAAVAGRRLAKLGLTAAEAQARLEVTEAYFDAVLSDRLVGIAELSLAQAETTLAQTRLGRQVGTQPEFDLLRAEVTRDNQRATVIQRRSQRTLTFLRFKQLLKLPVDQQLVLTTTLDEAPAGASSLLDTIVLAPGDTAVAARIAVQQLAEALTVQEVLTSVTRWDRVPTVKLTSNFARIGYPSDGQPWNADFVSDWTIGVNVSVPLWTSGRLRGNTMVAEASLAQARARLAQATDGAAFDARQSVELLLTGQAAWAATQGTVQQAERAYAIATIRYQEGISTQTELTDARLLLEQAQANRATAARDVRVARTRLALLRDLPLAGGGVSTTLSNAASGYANTGAGGGN